MEGCDYLNCISIRWDGNTYAIGYWRKGFGDNNADYDAFFHIYYRLYFCNSKIGYPVFSIVMGCLIGGLLNWAFGYGGEDL